MNDKETQNFYPAMSKVNGLRIFLLACLSVGVFFATFDITRGLLVIVPVSIMLIRFFSYSSETALVTISESELTVMNTALSLKDIEEVRGNGVVRLRNNNSPKPPRLPFGVISKGDVNKIMDLLASRL